MPDRSGATPARIAVTRPLPGDGLELLRAAGHEVVVRQAAGPASTAELHALASDADALICMLADRIDAPLLGGAPRLRAIANFAVGFDNIDLAAAAARGIAVGNTPDVLTGATADLTMALLLAAARRLPEGESEVREGRWRTWEPQGLLGLELEGARLCIVGGGRIGRAVARRAEGFGMQITMVGRHDHLVPAVAQADVLSLHCPLTDDTRGLVSAELLSQMHPGAILVNTARGQLVDQVALRAALESGQLAAAALDVTDPEPLPPSDPLLGAPNLIVLPHIGSATHAAREAMAERCARNVLAALQGEPMPWAVPLPRGA